MHKGQGPSIFYSIINKHFAWVYMGVISLALSFVCLSLSVCLEQCEGGAEGLSSVAVIMVSWCRVRDWHVNVNELSSAFLSTSTALMSPHVKRRGSSLRSRSSSSLSITSQCVGVAVSVCANVPLFLWVSHLCSRSHCPHHREVPV